MISIPVLSLLIWQPIAFAILLLSRRSATHQSNDRLAMLSAMITLVANSYLIVVFDPLIPDLQFVEVIRWLPMLNSDYRLACDGLALMLISLSSVITLAVLVTSKALVDHQQSAYCAIFLILQGLMNGLFCSQDALLFFVFFEAMLIPMYLCIGIWGSTNRSYAATKFFLYTFIGSIFLLIAILFLGLKAHSFSLAHLAKLPLTLHEQTVIMLMFWIAFAVKIPMFPLHTWLPDAHTEAPAGGSMILAALLLKVGSFGIYRFIIPITPDAMYAYWHVIVTLSIISITYIGFVALVQQDIKRLIAYSSVAHMGFVTLGSVLIFPISLQYHHNAEWINMAIEGSMIQMIAHGFSSAALFLAFGYIYNQVHERDIDHYGGLCTVTPVLSACFMLFCLSNIGLPGTAGFVGEFMVIISSAQANPLITLFAASTLILSASYTLWMYRRVFYGKPSQLVSNLKDVEGSFKVTLIVLALSIVIMGCYPRLITTYLQHTSHPLVAHALRSR
ncbi:MAG: NADH-quinone oxidoreductase subunit M [Legionellales bacterium]|nr:NADH-quinone oxidoreductase subunit M [Legionellales bacterium]